MWPTRGRRTVTPQYCPAGGRLRSVRRSAVLVITAFAAVLTGAAVGVSYVLPADDGRTHFQFPDPASTPSETASTSAAPSPAGPFLTAKPVTINSPGFWSWALLDTATGYAAHTRVPTDRTVPHLLPEAAEGWSRCLAETWHRYQRPLAITEAVVRVCHEGEAPAQMVREIMSREAKPE